MAEHQSSATAPIRLAVVGLGGIWSWQAQALDRLPQFRVVAACDNDPSRRAFAPEDVPFFDDYRGVISPESVDAVLVSTPYKTHFEIAQAALSSGLHVLVEKPAAQELADFHALCSLATSRHVSLVVALHFRFAPEVIWAGAYLSTEDGKSLGPLSGFWAGFYDPYGIDPDIARPFNSLGGSWLDSGINALSVVGRFCDLSRFGLLRSSFRRLPPNDVEVRGQATYQMTDPIGVMRVCGTIETNWLSVVNQKTTFLFFRESGSYVCLDHTAQTAHIFRSGRIHRKEECSSGRQRLLNHYLGVFADFHQHLRGGTDNRAFACEAHRLLFAACESPGDA
jgi:D-galactose 1-dehydrogenase